MRWPPAERSRSWRHAGLGACGRCRPRFATEMNTELGADADDFPEWLTLQIPLGRGGHPGELDQSILFLLGPGSSFVTGHVLTVDGGMAVR
jgi:gluconate 5-dehydrogenase